MIKEITYTGYSATPTDYECADGELSCALNCIYEDGSLKPLASPVVVATDIPGDILAIHRVPNYVHYIMHKDKTLYWAGEDTLDQRKELLSFDSYIRTVTPIGNTLVVLDTQGKMYYFLWSQGDYKYLGNSFPQLKAKPYLASRIFDIQEMVEVYGDEYKEVDRLGEELKNEFLINSILGNDANNLNDLKLSGNLRQELYEKIFSTLNLTNKLLTKSGYFTAPFYVRFAYRLYDGSHVMHTSPVLLVPTTWGTPLVNIHKYDNTGEVIYAPLYTASRLTVEIERDSKLSDWSDIITDIDIFVTPQLINYSDDPLSLSSISFAPYYNKGVISHEAAPRFMNNNRDWKTSVIEQYETQINSEHVIYSKSKLYNNCKSILYAGIDKVAYLYIEDNTTREFKLIDSTGKEVTFSAYISAEHSNTGLPARDGKYILLTSGEEYTYQGVDIDAVIYENTSRRENVLPVYQRYYLKLQRADDKKYKDVITDYSTFYKLHSIRVSTNYSGFIPSEKLETITAQETLSDLGQNRSRNIVGKVFPYNNRLNIIVKSEEMPECDPLSTQNPANGESKNRFKTAFVKIIENGQTAYHQIEDIKFVQNKLIYLSYPRATATELTIYHETSNGYTEAIIPLKRHPYLNLAYAFDNFQELETKVTPVADYPKALPSLINYGNIIKISLVNNPFVFSEENTSVLPVSEIHALSTAAKALSQGQFGQFPLYAFTTEGVWALEVSNTGTYSATQPITRDVVISPESITQIDSAVLFATDRGIMLLSGSTVQCISDRLNSDEPFRIAALPNAEALKKIFNIKADENEQIDSFVIRPFSNFLTSCRMLYDYTNQHIIVYNPSYDYAYVYSLKSHTWGMMRCDIASNFNSYPEALAMTKDGKLVNFSYTEAATTASLVITRPFKLDAPDTFKTIDTIIQRGMFLSTHVQQVLYGSNDLFHWHTVWSSVDKIMRGFRGTPYKAYRLALICNFDRGESIHSCTVAFEPRMTNHLR